AFSVMATSTPGRFMPSAAEKMASKIFDELRTILKMEEKLVEGSVSYFTPIADEKTAGDEILFYFFQLFFDLLGHKFFIRFKKFFV
ncbi:hypothetical protein VU01_10817, partial [Candidatus Electrothrix marina]